MASLRRSAGVAAILALCFASPGAAQGFVVTGELLLATGTDTVPVPDRWVVLHEVTVAEGGPVDSVRTDRRGRFRLRSSASDTLATYLLSARYHGIGYFSPPIDPDSLPDRDVPPIMVYDTASTGAPIGLAERHVLVRSPGSDGRRRVIELFVVSNAEPMTRISGADGGPVWSVAIPPVAEDVEIGVSDLASDAIEIADGALQVYAPIVPGQREVLIGYLLPAGEDDFVVTLDQPVARLTVLLGDSTAVLESPPLAMVGVEELEGQPLRRYGAEGVGTGTAVRIGFVASDGPVPIERVIVPVLVLLMALGFLAWHRRTPTGTRPDDPAVLAVQIAALDAEYRGREDDDYRRRRAELKERLSAALAAGKAES